MKVWAHVIATVVGFALAGLIVFLVFGNASREGALNEDAVVRGSADGSQCGTIAVAETATPTARSTALKNLPPLVNQNGLERQFSKGAGQTWMVNIQAAAGLCVDEIKIDERTGGKETLITLSTVDDVSSADISAYTAAAVVAGGQAPFAGRNITVITYVGDQKRSIYLSARAFEGFIELRRQLKLPTTVAGLIKFRQVAAGLKSGIRINGWS